MHVYFQRNFRYKSNLYQNASCSNQWPCIYHHTRLLFILSSSNIKHDMNNLSETVYENFKSYYSKRTGPLGTKEIVLGVKFLALNIEKSYSIPPTVYGFLNPVSSDCWAEIRVSPNITSVITTLPAKSKKNECTFSHVSWNRRKFYVLTNVACVWKYSHLPIKKVYP